MTAFTLRAPRECDAADVTDLFNRPGVIDGTLRQRFTPEKALPQWMDGPPAPGAATKTGGQGGGRMNAGRTRVTAGPREEAT